MNIKATKDEIRVMLTDPVRSGGRKLGNGIAVRSCGHDGLMHVLAQEKYGKYFDTLYNHAGESCLPLEKNALVSYVVVDADLRIVDTLVFTIENEAYGKRIIANRGGTFDWMSPENRSNNHADAIELKVKLKNVTARKDGKTEVDFFIGYIVPSYNTVILCDICHTGIGAELFHDVMEFILSKGILKTHRKVKTKKEKVKLPKVTLGCDPEFELLDKNGRVISLSENGSPYAGIQRSTSARVGADGAGAQVELRPIPASTPRVLVNNLRELFESVDYNAIMSAKGDYYPLGGHIHIGGVKHPTRNLIYLLDVYVGKVSSRMNGTARTNHDYGSMGDYREQPHGFEYRTPPSAIFSNPKITYVTMKIAQNIVRRYLTGFEFKDVELGSVTLDNLVQNTGITLTQARYYLNFARTFRRDTTYRKNVVAAWNRKAKNVPKETAKVANRPHVTLNIHDDWDGAVVNKLREAVSKLRRVVPGVTVTIYGLNESRGNVVSGLKYVRKHRSIAHPGSSNSVRFHYGMPLHFRMGNYSEAETNYMIRRIVREIRISMRRGA